MFRVSVIIYFLKLIFSLFLITVDKVIILDISDNFKDTQEEKIPTMTEELGVIYSVTLKLQQSFAEVNRIMETFFKRKGNEKPENPHKSINSSQILDKKKEERMGVRHRRKMHKIKNPDKKPKMPNPYILFCQQQKGVVRKALPQLSVRQFGLTMGKLWNNLDPTQKSVYMERYKQIKMIKMMKEQQRELMNYEFQELQIPKSES